MLPVDVVGWTVAALLLAALPHLLAMPPLLALLVALACAWRLLAAYQGWKLPPGWLRLIITLLALFLLFSTHGGLWGRRAATGLLCLMLGMKMLELGRIRDLRMVASVALFLVAAQFLFNQRLIHVAYLFASMLVTFTALQYIQRLAMGMDSRPRLHRHLLRSSGAMVLAALPIALVLFLAFPRLSQPLWGLPDGALDEKTGLSDSMTPGSIAELQIDSSPAFRAEFSGSPPPQSERYWRGPVFWNYDGHTWTRAHGPSHAPAAPVDEGSNDYQYSIQLEPHERRWLFALDYPTRVPDNARISQDFQITHQQPVTTLLHYSMRSNPDFIDMPVLDERLRRLALQLPEGRNPRTNAMAQDLRARFDQDEALIDHVLQWLHEEPFYYSLASAPLGRNGVDEFLFDLRVGYCEYYASAFAVLMRQAGIPARIATGYLGGYWQPGGNYLLLRHADAHAWVEVWLEGRGWTRVDPTAAVSSERIERGLAGTGPAHWRATWLRGLQNRYDRLQHLWNAWVLNFDAQRQALMLRGLGLPELPPVRLALLMTALLSAMVGAMAWLWLRPADRNLGAVERAWRKLQRRAGRQGLAARPAETPMQWAERSASRLRAGQGLLALAELYCSLHYGPVREVALEADFIRRCQTLALSPVEPPAPAIVHEEGIP